MDISNFENSYRGHLFLQYLREGVEALAPPIRYAAEYRVLASRVGWASDLAQSDRNRFAYNEAESVRESLMLLYEKSCSEEEEENIQ